MCIKHLPRLNSPFLVCECFCSSSLCAIRLVCVVWNFQVIGLEISYSLCQIELINGNASRMCLRLNENFLSTICIYLFVLMKFGFKYSLFFCLSVCLSLISSYLHEKALTGLSHVGCCYSLLVFCDWPVAHKNITRWCIDYWVFVLIWYMCYNKRDAKSCRVHVDIKTTTLLFIT